MNSNPWLIVLRSGHLLGYLIAGGIPLVMLFVVLPSVKPLSDEARTEFMRGVHKRLARLVHVAILVLLVTGFVNYLTIERHLHPGHAAYHATMGIKILLAFIVFFVGSALVGRSSAFERFRKRRSFWLGLNLLLVLAIVVIGALLRAMPDTAH